MKNVLILNRGEIALRALRSAKELKLKTFTPVNDSDLDSLTARESDKIIHFHDNINPFMTLDIIKNIIITNDIHMLYPGYGFLSEDPRLSRLCEELGIVFIGPNSSVLSSLSSKIESFEFAHKCQLKTLGLKNPSVSDFPLMLKASFGGGGRGNVICHELADFQSKILELQEKSLKLFQNSDYLIERYLPHARHVELQFVATSKKVHFLGTRDCSAQINFQKFLEEGPSSPESLNYLEGYFDKIANALLELGYIGVGTIEFLWDEITKIAYFMEINTRIQVEHPVTEMLYDIDLVSVQFLIALDNDIHFSFNKSSNAKHAICARVYAVDPSSNFSPMAGVLKLFEYPKFLRFDTHYTQGMEVSHSYDPLIGKIIVAGQSRQEAILKLKDQISQMKIYNGSNNIHFLNEFIEDSVYLRNAHDISYVQNAFTPRYNPNNHAFSDREKDFIWSHSKQMNDTDKLHLSYKTHNYIIYRFDDLLYVFRDNTSFMEVLNLNKPFWTEESFSTKDIGLSPISAKVEKVLVMDGQIIKKNEPLIVLEAMKTQITIFANDDLIINSVFVCVGDLVKKDQLLLGITYKV